MNYKCKCGSEHFFTKGQANHMGLYCSNCGKWQKWLNKNEVRALEETSTYIPIEKTIEDNSVIDLDNLKARIIRYCKYCEDSINAEYSQLPLSIEDSIRKNAKCHQLELNKIAFRNLLSGREFNDNGGG